MENKKEDFQRGIYKFGYTFISSIYIPKCICTKTNHYRRIIDINNEAIIGASILEKGTTNGTITDLMVNSRSKFPQNQL